MDDRMDGAAAESIRFPRPRSGRLGAIGLALAVLGFAAVVAGPFVEEALAPPPKPLSQELAEAARRFVGRARNPAEEKPAERPPLRWTWWFSAVGAGAGVLAASAGVFAWVRREDGRTAASAVIAGLGVVAWMYFQASFAVALATALAVVVLVVVSALLSV